MTPPTVGRESDCGASADQMFLQDIGKLTCLRIASTLARLMYRVIL